MAVLNPLKVILDNYPDDQIEEMETSNNPEDESKGKRKVPFSKEIFIERDDFMEDPPKKFFRLSPGGEVRLRSAYIIKCISVDKDATGQITALHCTYDPLTKSGMAESSRKVKGTLHWVSAKHAIKAEVRLYDRLFVKQDPEDAEERKTYKDYLNPDSLKVIDGYIEPSAAGANPGDHFQFERIGYFCVDKDSRADHQIFNRTVTLKDSWAKIEKTK